MKEAISNKEKDRDTRLDIFDDLLEGILREKGYILSKVVGKGGYISSQVVGKGGFGTNI